MGSAGTLCATHDAEDCSACNADYSLSGAATADTTTTCVVKTCTDTDGFGTDHACSTGYLYLPAHDAVTNPTDSACCYQMTCTDIDGKTDGSHADYQCPSGKTAGYVRYVTLTNDEIANDANCCHEKTCTDVDGADSDYDCPDGYAYVSANGGSKPPGYTNCCGESLSRFDPRAENI